MQCKKFNKLIVKLLTSHNKYFVSFLEYVTLFSFDKKCMAFSLEVECIEKS